MKAGLALAFEVAFLSCPSLSFLSCPANADLWVVSQCALKLTLAPWSDPSQGWQIVMAELREAWWQGKGWEGLGSHPKVL